MKHFTLHEDPTSGNCYKISLTASLLSIPIERRIYHVLKNETRTQEFISTVSKSGQIPVLQIDSSTFLPESNAACYYLADSTMTSSLIPSDALLRAEMLRWMFFEQNHHETCIATLRFWLKFIGKDKLGETQTSQLNTKQLQGRSALNRMNDHLAESSSGWFVGPSITLADICLYAYTHVAYEAGFDLEEWPAVKKWCEKVSTVDGYVAM